MKKFQEEIKTIYGDNKDEVEDLFKKVETDERLKGFAPDLMRVIFSLAQVRHLAILTMIDDDVYDIGSAKFENLKRNKIVHFDNLTTLYNESNARVRYFTPEEEPQLTQRTVLVDIDDESIIQAYENEHIHQEESEDLTSDFFTEVKGKPYTLKRNNDKKMITYQFRNHLFLCFYFYHFLYFKYSHPELIQ